jgi:hypothetical protein
VGYRAPHERTMEGVLVDQVGDIRAGSDHQWAVLETA